MIVLYEEGLEDVARGLSAMGYRMHPVRSMMRADAVLYVRDPHGALASRCGKNGALMLCVRSMSAAEISAAIKRRSVQPLF